jgi:hypothetical protein
VNANTDKQGKPAPEVSFESVRPLIEKAATSLVTLNLQVRLPLEDWIDLARHARANRMSIEQALLEFGAMNRHVLDVSSDYANALRERGRRTAQPPTKSRSIDFELEMDSWMRLQLAAFKSKQSLSDYMIGLVERDLSQAKARKARGKAGRKLTNRTTSRQARTASLNGQVKH